ncbi:putative leucine-rich repeat receptor-like protein kinase [Morus notabilis]|uniref:non-specific serine/threonine protein kinase n=1 Tax=Morus notabilis TaxID=981085 RepID=W9QGJ8_9ROSA|nr:putative leucine-rich repeat receptor-like protein kinase [Morus notabilis]
MTRKCVEKLGTQEYSANRVAQKPWRVLMLAIPQILAEAFFFWGFSSHLSSGLKRSVKAFVALVYSIMDQKLQLFLLLVFSKTFFITAENSDFLGLKSLEWKNTPPNWKGSDPCGSEWEGIDCTNSRVTSITLSSLGLEGQLSGEIDQLSELEALDLSYNKKLTGLLPESIGNLKKLSNLILVGCGFYGQIPGTIGSLQELVFLSLNSNRFTGLIPPAIGNLSKLYWLDLADNNIEGMIPISDGKTLGLDMLHHCKHFHLGKNKLTGTIPEELFSSSMNLIHVLFDNNDLTGSIPSTLGLVQTLQVVIELHSLTCRRLDGNRLSGDVPSNLTSLTKVTELFLSNNKLSGPLPNLSSLNSLSYLVMGDTNLKGQIPVDLFSLPNLETVVLKKNRLNGTLEIGTSYSNRLRLIDLQSNLITEFPDDKVHHVQIILVDNPVCLETGTTASYCIIPVSKSHNTSSNVTEKNYCSPNLCSSDQKFSPNCKCAYPYTGTLYFRAPSFSDLDNTTYYKLLEQSLMSFFQMHLTAVDSVSLSNPDKGSFEYLHITLEVFPSGRDHFNRTEISHIGFALSNQTYKPPKSFGPYYFIGDQYESYSGTEVPSKSNKSSKLSTSIIIGAVAGGSALVLLLLLAGVYSFRQRRRAERATEKSNPFVHWDSNATSGGVPQLKGARWFSFEEIEKCTNNFSAANAIGSGGYGKVYRGTLATGEVIAVKRLQSESKQGKNEFKTEIELLSRVHHKNLVTLVGFCFEKGEQMLIYEYAPNGSLKDSLTEKSGIRLDWMRRLRVALGTARGLAYLHELADPPIIHRDIKSTNVLLDDRLNAKVADFGLSKLMGDGEKDHVSTQVKGTMGYLDPEYYMTQHLNEKSDVYSFGVLMLELITARKPIEQGKYIVREVRMTMDKTKDLYNLDTFLDPAIGLGTRLIGFERFVDLAMRCVEDARVDRPSMSEVVKEIEAIMQHAGLNPNADSASISASYEEANKQAPNHPYSQDSFDHSGSFPQ